jgi:hypothetical protein
VVERIKVAGVAALASFVTALVIQVYARLMENAGLDYRIPLFLALIAFAAIIVIDLLTEERQSREEEPPA